MDFWKSAEALWGYLWAEEKPQASRGSLQEPFVTAEPHLASTGLKLWLHFGEEAQPLCLMVTLADQSITLYSSCCGMGLGLKNRKICCELCGTPLKYPLTDWKLSFHNSEELKQKLLTEWSELLTNPLNATLLAQDLLVWVEELTLLIHELNEAAEKEEMLGRKLWTARAATILQPLVEWDLTELRKLLQNPPFSASFFS